MGKLKSYSTVSRHHSATTRLATQMTNVSALMRCQRRYVFTFKFTLFKNKPQNIRAGGLQIISTPQLPLAMWPGLCLSATEMALQIFPSEKKKLKKVLKNQAAAKSSNSGVTWGLVISLMGTTGPVKNSTLNKGRLRKSHCKSCK